MPSPVASASSILFVLGAASGCPSLSNLHTARPLPVDETELAFAVGAYSFRAADDSEPDGEDLLPFIEVEGRRGLTEHLDAGVRLTSFTLIGVDFNYALYEGETIAVSLDPSASLLAAPIFSAYLWLPLLVDFDLSDVVTLTLRVRAGHAFVDTLSEGDDGVGLTDDATLFGAGIGLRWQFAERWAIVPEWNIVVPEGPSGSEDALTGITLGFVH